MSGGALIDRTVTSRLLRDRISLAHQVSDVPTVLLNKVEKEDRKRVERLREARDLLMAGATLAAAAQAAELKERRVQTLMDRYLQLAEDGRVGGERVFLRGWKLQGKTVRTKPFDPSLPRTPGSMTGLFGQLMATNDPMRDELIKQLRRKGKDVLQVNQLVGRELRKLLHKVATEKGGLTEADYPLFPADGDGGLRPFRHWIKTEFLSKYARDWIEAEEGPNAGRALTTAQPKPTVVTQYEPYVDWQLDEVRVDDRCALEMLNLRGDPDVVEIECFKIIRLIELGHNTNLAFIVVYGREVNAWDLGELMWRALNGWKPPNSLGGLQLEPGAGFPIMAIEELRWRSPRRIFLDNALAHLSTVFGVIAEAVMGADVCLGTVASPKERAEIESKFAMADRRFHHQLPGTKGTGPLDPQAKRHADLPPRRLVRAEDLEHAYYVMVANENGMATTAAFGIAPLERLRRAVTRGAIRAVPISLTKRLRHAFFPAKRVLVHAGDRKPYINFDRVRYHSDEFERRYDLVGKYLYACCDPDDLRVLVLYAESGAEICRVYGEGRWGVIPHDHRMRKMALRNIDKQARGRMPQDGPVVALFARLTQDAETQPKAALQLAHCLAVLGRHTLGEYVDPVWLSKLVADGMVLDAAAQCEPTSRQSPSPASSKPAAATGPSAPRSPKSATPPADAPSTPAHEAPLRTTPRRTLRL